MVRPLRREDREAVLDIVQATSMFTPDEVFFAREQVDIYLEQPHQRDYFLVVVEAAGGKVVGYLSYGSTPLTDAAYDLYWMAVAPTEQGRGYGRELMRWLENRVKEAGGRVILIETSSEAKYEGTRRFYLGQGYGEVARIPDFYKPGDDRITFAKYFV
jgi:ribosomal protein S18 acetylase RimI-like enzyme